VLRQLHADFGKPSYRQIAAAAQERGFFGRDNETEIGSSTFSDLLRGKTEAGRKTVEAFVVGCIGAGKPADGLAADKLRPGYWLRAFDAAALTPVVDSTRFADRPSQLLVTEHEIVEFTGRVAELAELAAWRDGEARLSALWLHGPGGQGKTRLGRRFAAGSAKAGWRVEASWGATGQRGDLLVVVDYADRVPHTDLVALFDRHTGARHRTRILLLARSTSPWSALRHELAGRDATAADLSLPALADSVADRARVFALARDAFAKALGVTDADVITPPADLDHPDFGLALSLHMAALVAVDAHLRQVTPPTRPADLSTYLLDREEAHWVRLLQRPDFRTVPHAMRRAVFAACLIGARPYAEATRAFAYLSDPQTVLIDHSYCYPAADPSHVLQPLLPDRLAEDFLALTLRAQQWAGSDLAALLSRPADGAAPIGVERAITFLAAASAPGRHPDVATHLEALLQNDPRLAVDAGGAALVALTHLSPVTLVAVDITFPVRDPNLDVGMFAVLDAVVTTLPDAIDDATRAALLMRLATRAWAAGVTERLVPLCREAVALTRALPGIDPVELAMKLSNASELLADIHTAEAVEMAEEARRLLTAVAAEDSEAAALLISPLLVLGNAARNARDHERALGLFTQAVEQAQRTDENDLPGYGLAGALTGLGQTLMVAGRYADALPVLQRAVAALDGPRSQHPMAFESERSAIHALLAGCLQRLGQGSESERHSREALATTGRLAELNPAAHADRHARALLVDAARQADIGDFRAAEELARRAVDIARGRHPVLAQCLVGLAGFLHQAGQWEQVWPLLDEASELAIRLGADHTLADMLSDELDDHLTRLEQAGRTADVAIVRRRVVELTRSMIAHHTGTPDLLARRLDQFGVTLIALDKFTEATTVLREAVTIREHGDPEPLARTSGLLGTALYFDGAPGEEVLDLLTRAVADHPGRHELGPDRGMLVGALLVLLPALVQNDRHTAAAELGEQWVDLLADTARADPRLADQHVLFLAGLSMALVLAGQVASAATRADQALAAATGVGDAARAAALHAFAMSRVVSGQDVEQALAANSESIDLFTRPGDLVAAHQIRASLLEMADQKRM